MNRVNVRTSASLFLLVFLAPWGLRAEVRYNIIPIHAPVGIDTFGIGGLGLNDLGSVVGEFGHFPSPDDLQFEPARHSEALLSAAVVV